MNLHLVLAAVCFALAMCGCLAANANYYSMIEEINKHRPIDKQILLGGFGSNWALFDNINEYRRLFPSGKLLLYQRFGFAFMIAGLASTALFLVLR